VLNVVQYQESMTEILEDFGDQEIPRFMDVLAEYKNADEMEAIRQIQKQKSPTKLLSENNRAIALEVAMKAQTQHAEVWANISESTNKEGCIFNLEESLGDNRILIINARILKPDNEELINFQIEENGDCIASLTLVRPRISNWTQWIIYDRQVGDEYKGGGDNNLGVSSIIIDCAQTFIKQYANIKDEEMQIDITFSQPQVGIWCLKNGFLPSSEQEVAKWNKMCHPHDKIPGEPSLDMREDFMVFPSGFKGFSRYAYNDAYRVHFRKVLSSLKSIETNNKAARNKCDDVLSA